MANWIDDLRTILGKVTPLPTDPADESALEAAITAAQGVITGAITTTEGVITAAITAAQGVITGAITTSQGVITGAITTSEGVITAAITAAQGVITGAITTTQGVITGAITTSEGVITAAITAAQGVITAAITAAQTAIITAMHPLTTFGQETAGAIDANGVTWVDLLDKSTITKPTILTAIILTKAGTWAGTAQWRIVTGAGVKIYPHETVDSVDSGVEIQFGDQPVVVPVANGYKIQFNSTNAGDGVGETVALTQLAKVEVG